MLPRFEFLFSRGPPSARSSQIRPHPVTVRHLSVSFLLPLSRRSRAAYSLTRRAFPSLAEHNNGFSLSQDGGHGVVWPRGGQEYLALPDPSCKYAAAARARSTRPSEIQPC